MDFFQIDVFTDEAYEGNPLAVFPESVDLNTAQMQRIAKELNLSETTFVTEVSGDTYRVRIFTPDEELPFAGHPTIGTAWMLRELGRVAGEVVYQESGAGRTKVVDRDGVLWLERQGRADPDIEDAAPDLRSRIAAAIGLAEDAVDMDAREMGRAGMLRPGIADAGLEQLMVPVRDLDALQRSVPRSDLLGELPAVGVYVFTAVGAGRLRSRGYFPGVGVPEDPGTGSAAAALGLYLDRRLGDVDLDVLQGVEVGRPCHIRLRAGGGTVQVGGACTLVLRGSLERSP